ncbi:MAG: hypothetical protein ACI8ZB_002586 [Desulforhopalus sp.]|jgi:hypothetical protein
MDFIVFIFTYFPVVDKLSEVDSTTLLDQDLDLGKLLIPDEHCPIKLISI